jgi:lipopolysaccharide export system permease protein
MRFRPFGVLTRYTLSSVIKVGLATAALAALMLVGVDLFSNLDTYISYNVSFGQAFLVSLLYFPEALLLAVGPSFLFSVTYFLSMLSANNEMICVLNSGVSLRRVVVPCLVLAVLLSVGYFFFNEKVAISASNLKDSKYKALTSRSSSLDNSDIALSDMQDGYMIYAGQFVDESSTLYNVSYVEIEEGTGDMDAGALGQTSAQTFTQTSGQTFRRIDAYRAQYDAETENWTLYDCYEYVPVGNTVQVNYYSSLEIPRMRLEPQLFRNLSSEISKMSLDLAHAYVLRMKSLNPDEYARLGTEYYKRIFSCLTPLVMIIIACSMNYKFKKNVLFFSLICSICVAVVYFVVQMVTVMLADQGVIAPYWGTLIPFIVVLLLSGLMSAFLKS